MALIAALMVGVGSGLFQVEQMLARTGLERADLQAAGVDGMPVGTATQAERFDRAGPHRS